jgi:hypothetical protein
VTMGCGALRLASAKLEPCLAGARLERLLKKTGKQIPRRLKPARDDNIRGLTTAHPSVNSGQALKVRPFTTLARRLFHQSVEAWRKGIPVRRASAAERPRLSQPMKLPPRTVARNQVAPGPEAQVSSAPYTAQLMLCLFKATAMRKSP